MKIVGVFMILVGGFMSLISLFGLLMWSDGPVTYNPLQFIMAGVGILLAILGIALIVRKEE